MRDDLRSDIDAVEDLDGATAPLFPRVFVAGVDGGEARRGATALAAALAADAEAVTDPELADLIVAGSAADGPPGHTMLDPSVRPLLDGASCPVAVAPRGLAEREGYELRRIDVGIDGGREAAAALAVGIRLALAHSARLRLIAIAEHGFDLGGTAREADPREVERLSRRLEHATDGLAGIWVETELREGLPDQILLGLARDAELLVLGSRTAYGKSGRTVVGAVAARVLRASPCPVMIVPAP